MELSRTADKVGLYILSLLMLFVFIIILTLDIPYCFGKNCQVVSLTTFWEFILDNYSSIIALVGIAVGLGFYVRFDHSISGGSLDAMEVKKCDSESYEHLVFLATYIIPFVGFTFDQPRKVLAYFLLLTVIGLIFIRTDKYYANPTLALLGYKLFKVTAKCRNQEYKNITIITKDEISPGDCINFKCLSREVYFARKIT